MWWWSLDNESGLGPQGAVEPLKNKKENDTKYNYTADYKDNATKYNTHAANFERYATKYKKYAAKYKKVCCCVLEVRC